MVRTGLIAGTLVLTSLTVIPVIAQTNTHPRTRSTASTEPGYLGIGVQDLDPQKARDLSLKDAEGIVVTAVTADAPGIKAGIRVNDVIREINGQKVTDQKDFQETILKMSPGAKATITVDRENEKHKFVVTLGSRPAGLPLTSPVPGMIAIPAIPVGAAAPPDLQAMMAGDAPRIGFEGMQVGAQLAAYFGVQDGVLVVSVAANLPAGKAGLKAGDVITKVNSLPVINPREISGIVRAAAKKSVTFTVVRNKKETPLTIEIGN